MYKTIDNFKSQVPKLHRCKKINLKSKFQPAEFYEVRLFLVPHFLIPLQDCRTL